MSPSCTEPPASALASGANIGVKPVLSTRSTATANGDLIEGYAQSGYSHVLISITNAQYREKSKHAFQKSKMSHAFKVPSPTGDDVNIFPGSHVQHTIGLIASWIELEHQDDKIAEFSRQVLLHELEYAKFIGLKHLIIAPPKDLLRLSAFSSTIKDILSFTRDQQIVISISLPICEEYEDHSSDPFGTWDMWNSIRTNIDYNRRLKISLALTKNAIPLEVVLRWFAEPVSCLLMSSSIFILNSKGYPVISKSNQQILHMFNPKSPILLLHGLEKAPETVDVSSYQQYLSYVTHKSLSSPLSKMAKFSENHNDVLLPPLQPLQHNLDDFTYNVFEKDDVKYNMYGKAVYSALQDLSHLSKINIAIVGAGKGGLVDVTVAAMKKLGLTGKCHISAIEKNGSAVVCLDQRNKHDWDNCVKILQMDMRDWSPSESYNVIISELLGSFGCNELSPECLKPLEVYLDRVNGVFIPQSYISHIAPVFSPKLFTELKDYDDSRAFHKQYVVKMNEVAMCSNKVNDLWTFENPSMEDSLRRREISTFKIRHKTIIHGLAGYFTAKLYKDITISTRPDQHTTDLISWFPLFFPLEQPLYVTDDTELEVSITRDSRQGRIWYSWSLESFMYLVEDVSGDRQVRIRTNGSKIHNHGGCGFAAVESALS